MVTGKEFIVCRDTSDNASRLRRVPPFSIQSLQPNTKVVRPPRCHVFGERIVERSSFRRYFLRGELPICRAYDKNSPTGAFLAWRIPPAKLDYCRYLPIFFEGLCESTFPYKIFARRGVHDLLNASSGQVLSTLPLLIMPIKNALSTRSPDVIVATLRCVQQLLMTEPFIGEALVPYYRQLLPILSLYRSVNTNIYDKVDFKQATNVGDVCEETLQLLEKCGGRDAFINIKYMVPAYESCVLN